METQAADTVDVGVEFSARRIGDIEGWRGDYDFDRVKFELDGHLWLCELDLSSCIATVWVRYTGVDGTSLWRWIAFLDLDPQTGVCTPVKGFVGSWPVEELAAAVTKHLGYAEMWS